MNMATVFAESLRELADFYEAHQDFSIPNDPSFLIYCNSKQELVTAARALGGCEKKYQADYFSLVKRFGILKLDLFLARSQVCRSKIVGVKRVEERVIPAHDEPVVEWECADTPLLAESPKALPDAEVQESQLIDDIPF